MPMKNPPHPGRIVRQECLEATGLSVTDAANERAARHFPGNGELAFKSLRQRPGGVGWPAIRLRHGTSREACERIKVRRVPYPVNR